MRVYNNLIKNRFSLYLKENLIKLYFLYYYRDYLNRLLSSQCVIFS